ncbi:hypothetical protein [uncultured Gammaproteobacteria bacterium]|jgi:hypothetical protein|nr:hypothetical protein [uncultured Gammaproteobacteria bacterium]
MYFILYKTNYFFIKHYDPLPICIFTLKIDNCVSFFCCVILDSYIKPCKSPRSSRKTKKILQANKTSDASAVAKLDDDLGLLKQGNTLITWQTLNTPH